MPTLESILQKKLNLIESAPEKFITSTGRVQEKLLNDVLKLVGELDTSGGSILPTQANINRIEIIADKLRGVLYQGEYAESVKQLISEMDDTTRLTNSYFKKLIPKTEIGEKLTNIYVANRTKAIENLIGTSSIDANFLQPFKDTLLQGITNEMSFSDLVTNLTQITTGDEERDGKLQKYVKQIASDTFSTTERNYTSMLAFELGVQFVRYSGGLIEDSRCFCEQRNGKYFHIEEVRAWGDGDLTAGGLDNSCNIGGGKWQGMYIETNRDNIEMWLGGYNCKHSINFVSEINVPDAVKKRAAAAGYYKPKK